MSAELRHRIKIISDLSKNEVIEKFKKKLEDTGNTFSGWTKEGYALVTLQEKEKRIWTPQLNLQIDEYDEGSEISGVIGPSASVWTAFVFSFSILGFIALIALFWGLSRLSLDYSADILWLVPISLILILGIYLLAKIGQQVCHDQVRALKYFVESTINEN